MKKTRGALVLILFVSVSLNSNIASAGPVGDCLATAAVGAPVLGTLMATVQKHLYGFEPEKLANGKPDFSSWNVAGRGGLSYTRLQLVVQFGPKRVAEAERFFREGMGKMALKGTVFLGAVGASTCAFEGAVLAGNNTYISNRKAENISESSSATESLKTASSGDTQPQ